jgi:hypothetical protein
VPVQGKEESSSPSPGSGLDRRSFLRKAATGLGASAVLSLPGVGHAVAATGKKTKTAYRLSTHGRRACSACKGTGANRFYVSADAANNGRAHLGCNCGIVTQELLKATWSCYFRGGKAPVYDLRWHRPKCPKP